MGLDAVELVMETEQHFGITLPDSEVEGMRTVGDLAAVVASRLPKLQEGVCPLARDFYALRHKLMTVSTACGFPLDPRSIRPRAPLKGVLGTRTRRVWRAMARGDRRWPRLVGSAGVERVLQAFVLVLVAAVIGLAAIGWSGGLKVGIGAAVASTLVAVAVYRAVAWVSRRQVPPSVVTFGDLTRAIVPRAVMPGPGVGTSDRDVVLQHMIKLVAEFTGRPTDQISRDTRFAEDLDF